MFSTFKCSTAADMEKVKSMQTLLLHNFLEQAEAEVVPSSSSVKVKLSYVFKTKVQLKLS